MTEVTICGIPHKIIYDDVIDGEYSDVVQRGLNDKEEIFK